MTDPDTFNKRQKRGRDEEWKVIAPYLAERSNGIMLEVGCGTGYAMAQAMQLGLDPVGIDPEPQKYGVHDADSKDMSSRIATAAAEELPFTSSTFDVVYSSHAIEHFRDTSTGIAEMSRVLRSDGLAVIMVPTGTMAAILVVSRWLFYTHRAVAKFLIRKRTALSFLHIFAGEPHGTEAKTAIGEIRMFSIKRWRGLVGKHFYITQELLPCLYPWPDYPPLFPMMKLRRFSTSVVFICRKREAGTEKVAK